jgi:glucose-6-phosphate isomerase
MTDLAAGTRDITATADVSSKTFGTLETLTNARAA